MTERTLRSYFKSHGITARQIADRTGYDLTYLYGLLGGSERMTDSAKFRLIRAYPDLAVFFLTASSATSDESPHDSEPAALVA